MDLPDRVKVSDISIPFDTIFESSYDKELLGGIVVLEGKARINSAANWENTLYRELDRVKTRKIDVRLIPYYAWDNRGDSEMAVWMPLENSR
jgi:hypothetical protein